MLDSPVDIQELVPVGAKNDHAHRRSGALFAEPSTREDAELCFRFSKENNLPLIVLGSGSNTVFADG